MSKPFDATLKDLLEVSPGDWPSLLGYPHDEVRIIDADVSTVSGGADKVLAIRGDPDWILHLEFQAGPDSTLPRRTLGYNATLENRHTCLVRTVIVLLRPQADLANLTGVYQRQFAGEEPYLVFRYHVVRVWQLPVERVLASGLGTLPLAPISAVAQEQLPGVIARMQRRLRDRPSPLRSKLWTASYILMGMRYEQSLVRFLLRGVSDMEESATYQAILEQGALREARKTLLLLGRDQFGVAPARVRKAIEGIDNLERLEKLIVKSRTADNWQELLDLPQSSPRRR